MIDLSARAREWLREVFGKYDKTTDLVSMRLSDLLTEIATAARTDEREACAVLAVEIGEQTHEIAPDPQEDLSMDAGDAIAKAIRDREPQ